FAVMIRSGPIASAAIESTGAPRSAGAVVAATFSYSIKDTNILVIGFSDTDPAVAQTLSIGIAEAFVKKITELEPGKAPAEGDLPTAPARIFERAKLPVVPKKDSILSSLIVAGLLGAMLSGGAVLLVEYLDVTVKSVED